MIQFRFNPVKAAQAVHQMLVWADGTLDFHTLLKAVYFADREMLNKHARPIFGATYRAMNYGPVPLQVYEMLKAEPYWLSEIGADEYPWVRQGSRVSVIRGDNRNPETDHLARIELELLESALNKSRGMTFDQRTRETHGMDWVQGTQRYDERMAYEDMIAPDHPLREELIEDLEAMGPRIVL
ncbi:Panacea domain-containing protein [Pararhodobacter aggregans]|uniref:Panacea domain-containing protein n=1 Tax=Pararhodobacter aggregans TaxID=404875 RepID=UPI003A91574F